MGTGTKRLSNEAKIQISFESDILSKLDTSNADWNTLAYGKKRNNVREAMVWSWKDKKRSVHVDIARVNIKEKIMFLFELKQNTGYAISQCGYLRVAAGVYKEVLPEGWEVFPYMVAPIDPTIDMEKLKAEKRVEMKAEINVNLEDPLNEKKGKIDISKTEFDVIAKFLQDERLGLILLTPEAKVWEAETPKIENVYVLNPQHAGPPKGYPWGNRTEIHFLQT